METSPLFDLDLMEPEPGETAPRCPMCVRGLRWNPKRNEYHRYCGGWSCTNRNRVCYCCGIEYNRDRPGTGNKYCSAACRQQRHTWMRQPGEPCGICGVVGERAHRGANEYLCATCTEPIKHVMHRLRMHHVSVARIRRLIAEPTCELCDVDIVTPVVHAGGGRPRPLMVVDHNHACCPGAVSCGKCVRGLVCGNCNTALGLAGDNPDRLERMAAYLRQ